MRHTHSDMYLEIGDIATIATSGYGDLEIGGTRVRVLWFEDHPNEPDEMAEVEVVKATPKARELYGWQSRKRLTYPVSLLRSERYEREARLVDSD